MATISHVIRWADNTKELQQNLREGVNQIEAMRKSAEGMAKSLGGDALIRAAHNAAAAVQQIGGATKLTEAEKARLNVTIQKAIDKYQALGQEAPRALAELLSATQRATTATDKMAAGMAAMGQIGRKAFQDAQASDGLIAGMSAAGRTAADVGKKIEVAFSGSTARIKSMADGIAKANSDLVKLSASFSGKDIMREASLAAAAVQSIGGASRLTAAEKSRLNSTLQQAIDKYRALGQTAPKVMVDLANATKQVEPPTSALTTKMVALGSAIGTFLGNALYDLARRGKAAVVDGFRSAIDVSNRFQASFIGLSALAEVFGVKADEATRAARALSSDGLMTVAETASGLKNLLAAGFGLPEAVKLMEGFKDSAAFNRQASLGFGQAVVSATEGIKNQNSILIDNAGITKNYSVIMKEAGLKTEDMARISSDAGVRQKVYAGLLRETGIFAGNAALATQTYTGAVSKLGTAWNNAKAQLGDAITRNQTVITTINLVSEALTGLQGGTEETSRAFAIMVSETVIFLVDMAKGAVDAAQAIYQAYHTVIGMIDLDWKQMARGMMELFHGQIASIMAALVVMRKFDPTGNADKHLKMLVAVQAALINSTKTNDVFSASLDKASKALAHIRSQLGETVGKMVELQDTAGGGGKFSPPPIIDTTTSDFIESAEKSIKKLTAELKLVKNITDADFLKQFASDLDRARVTLDQLGISGAKVPKEIAAGFERLERIRMAEFFKDMATDASKFVHDYMEKFWKEQNDIAAKAGTALLSQVKRIDEARTASARLAMTSDIDQTQHAINMAKARGDSVAKVYALERELSAKKRDALIHDAQRELFEKTAALDRTTTLGKIEYDELMAAHKATVDQITADWIRGEELRRQSLESFGKSFKALMHDIPGTIARAFEGGGGLSGALMSLGARLGADLGKSIGTAIGGKFGGEIGEAAGGFLVKGIIKGVTSKNALVRTLTGFAVLGPLGALAAGIFGGRGPTKEELEGREAVKRFEEQIHSLLTETQRLEAGNVKWKMTVVAVRDAYLATGRSALDAERDVKRLWDSSVRGAEAARREAERINEILMEAKADQDRLTAAIEKYGFTVDQLGPAFRNQRLAEQAKELIEDWRVLVASGIDMRLVNDKMAASFNDFLQIAIRTGSEVPIAMKPILQTLIDQGKLVDANGNLITDLERSGISFAETMTQGFDRVVVKLQQLIDTLQGAGEKIGDLPTSVVIDVEMRLRSEAVDKYIEGIRSQNLFGNLENLIADQRRDDLLANPSKPIPMADGGIGRVTGPTLFLAGERGPEEYAFSGANRSFVGPATPDGGGDTYIDKVEVHVDGSGDPDATAEAVMERVIDFGRRNHRQYRTRLRGAYGVA